VEDSGVAGVGAGGDAHAGAMADCDVGLQRLSPGPGQRPAARPREAPERRGVAELGDHLRGDVIAQRRIVELDWWISHACGPGAEVTLVPALHWSRRSPFETNLRLWGGFMLRAGARLVYFAGDSGYRDGLFADIGRRCGAPDLALIPIGAYAPRWFMRDAHMDPEEAVRCTWTSAPAGALRCTGAPFS